MQKKNNSQLESSLSLSDLLNQLSELYQHAFNLQQEKEYLQALKESINNLKDKFNFNKQEKEQKLAIFKRLDNPEYNLKKENIKELKTGLKLTFDQEKALQQIQQFILATDSKYFRLTGYAGTGKSYLMIELMAWLKVQKLDFVAASPTNKASSNLWKLANENGLNIDVTTIAKLLGQQPKINQDSGEQIFVTNESVSLNRYDVIILDEFSMISQNNFYEIINAVNYADTKIIFVGDAAQLPPVGEKQPIVETSDLIEQSAVLSEVVRFEGELRQVAEEIRNNPTAARQLYTFSSTSDQSMVCLQRSQWLSQAADYFRSGDFRSNADFCRILVWRNKTADMLNDWLRRQLWGENALAFVEGDRLIAKKPVFRLINNSSKKRKDDWRIVMNNSEECEVIDQPRLKEKNDFNFWQVPVLTDDGNELMLKILTPESEQKRQDKLEQLRKEKKWAELLNLDKSYDYCPFAYALTTHKAQGSSLEYIFLDLQDMRGCTDLQKILYTALTRAKIRAYVSR
jgi:ATP-dependent exoDNAse (exonuclease V) alpha subunit